MKSKYYNPMWDKVHIHEWEFGTNNKSAYCSVCGWEIKAATYNVFESKYWILPVKGVRPTKKNVEPNYLAEHGV